MLSTIIESLNARPQRLVNKSQKFYDVTPVNTISNEQKMSEAEQADIDEIIKWLDEIWLAGELGDWTEDEYLEFRKAVEESAE